jgi:hypothetical protein
MKTLHTLLLIAIAATTMGCVNSPRNNSFLEGGVGEAIPLNGITDGPNEIVKFQAFNFTTNTWDNIATAISEDQPITADNHYAFEAASKVLPLDYWEALTQNPTYRRRAKVRAVFPESPEFNLFGYFDEGEETDQCILDHYEASGTNAARTACQVGAQQPWAYVYTCKFGPCESWL